MNSLSITTRKSLMLFSGRAYPELAEEVGKYLDVSVTPQSAYDFANGEIFVRFEESVRGSDAFLARLAFFGPRAAAGSWSCRAITSRLASLQRNCGEYDQPGHHMEWIVVGAHEILKKKCQAL